MNRLKLNFLLILSFTFTVFKVFSFDFSPFQTLLDNNLKTEKVINNIKVNVFDYDKVYKDTLLLDKLVYDLRSFNVDSISDDDSKAAFWINVYNIAAIKMIIDNYPVDSIRSSKINLFKNPWGIKVISVGGIGYSLGQIEHEILFKKYKKLTAHFGVVCASLSCPDLATKVYTKYNLDELLSTQASLLFTEQNKGLKIDKVKKEVYISKIFSFDKKNFPQGKSDIIPFILPYITNDGDKDFLKSMDYDLKFFEYDWSLNKLP